jgi:glycosyltransferase involved in cell wall biosynthesis
MELLFVIYSLEGGGAERVTTTLANHWASQGWSITLVTLAGGANDFFALDSRIVRVSLNLAGVSGGLLSGLLANLRRLRALRQLLRQRRPRVAVAMMSSANVLLALAAFGLKDLVTIGSERSHPPQRPLGRFWGGLRWFSYCQLCAVVAQTSVSARWISRHTLARRVAVIENPLPTELRNQPPQLDPARWLAADDRVLLAVGRLSQEKGFDLLLESWSTLANHQPHWRLVILGEGPERASLEAQIQALGLDRAVLLPGRAGNVSDWYRRADLFVLSSRFEGFPNVLAEAMASGLAVVSTDCPTGPAAIVRDGVDGLLVPMNQPAALREALARLMHDDAMRASMAQCASQIAGRLELEVVAGRWRQLFAALGARS